jgi:hypothetical protein
MASEDTDVDAKAASITTSATVVVSRNLLLWSGWDEGIGSYDSVGFFTRAIQSLMLAMINSAKVRHGYHVII